MPTIQTGSVLERSVLKEGQIYLVADRAGDIRALNLEGHGLYFRDTRHLSLFEMDLTGTRLTLLSAAGELNFMSNLQFANDTLLGPSGEVIAEPRTISIRRNRFLHNDGLHERLGLVNYNQHPIQLTLRFTFGSDFRDMFVVRGYFPEERVEFGQMHPIEILPDGVLLGYTGTDRIERHTHITFDPPPASIEILNDRLRRLDPTESLPGIAQWSDPREEGRVWPPIAAAVFKVDLEPMQSCSITVHVRPEAGDEPTAIQHDSRDGRDAARLLDSAFVVIRDSYDEWRSACTTIETDHELFDQLLRRALQDLRLLIDNIEGDLVPSAGIPWFAVPFGRDSMITSMQTLSLRPSIAAGTLRFLAQHQGKEVNDFRDEQPGKILHEVRLGELAKLQRVPHSTYYGSVDSTPLFLMTLGEYVRWSGDLDLARSLLPNAEAALAWMRDYGDIDGDGLIEYYSRSSEGMRNQGWKDSYDSASHRDGSLAEPPIALVEVQAYAYAAHREMAELYARFGDAVKEREERTAAERCRQQFVSLLAMQDDEDGPFWAMGLDREKRRIETVTSNPGHALWSGLLRGDDARLTVQRLLGGDMLCGWGVRTLSSRARTFNPMSYHNGSIWPHDNALIALGMKRAGADTAAREVATQVFEAGLRFPASRLPELWCGFSRDRRYHSTPAQYPVSCSPQAWAAGSAFMLLQALLGLEADAFERVVRLRPVLPSWLGRVSFRNMRVAGSQIDFDVIREGHRVLVDVIDDGGLRVEARDASPDVTL
jgi:glycogen debranching enzyme